MTTELERLEIEFEAAGGRGVELAERIDVLRRLEELRAVIRAERISYSELYELQTLADKIDPFDVELLEWAGVPEEEARERQEEASRLRNPYGEQPYDPDWQPLKPS